LSHGKADGGEKPLGHALGRVHNLAMLDYPLQAIEMGAEVARDRGHHRVESVTARVPTRGYRIFIFPQHLNVDIRGVAAENAVPIAITSRRVMIYEVETVVPSLGIYVQNGSRVQVI
jgi:hypothetical protein